MARPKIERPLLDRNARPKIERPTRTGRQRVRKASRDDPEFETLFEDDGDPLEDVEYDEDDLEASAEAEMSEVVRQIKEERAARRERFRVARDPDYYLVLCFQSRAQRDEFNRLSGLAAEGVRFVNGLEVARQLGIEIEAIPLEPLPQRGKPHLYSREEVL